MSKSEQDAPPHYEQWVQARKNRYLRPLFRRIRLKRLGIGRHVVILRAKGVFEIPLAVAAEPGQFPIKLTPKEIARIQGWQKRIQRYRIFFREMDPTYEQYSIRVTLVQCLQH